MKVGLILEGLPDRKVIEYLAKRINPEIKVVSRTLGKKPDLIADCGEIAKLLLELGCDRVIIVWDLFPAEWENPVRTKQLSMKKTRPTCWQDRKRIKSELEKAAVDPCRVCLVCIDAMLETWLLTDIRAVNVVLSTKTHRAKVKPSPKLERNQDPKTLMINVFRREGRGRKSVYSDVDDAIRIAKAIPKDSRDLNRLRKLDSFVQFERCIANDQAALKLKN
ncbi:MAG: hypothetical protein OXI34_05940 [Chloroflexota bacterium]|nr:hypothetical protein [Chloroflexota bacterium]MDE2948702.1 hypothetical protein [Chloroflexota bacterium]